MKNNLCEICKTNVAIMTVTEVDAQGNKYEIAICEVCAQKKGIFEPDKIKNINELLALLLKTQWAEEKNLVCSSCGLSFPEFRKYGRLGCAHCYQAFEKKIIPFIRRLQETEVHLGKKISEGVKATAIKEELRRIKEELKKAVLSEDYEKAARLRDLLKTKQEKLKN